MYRLVNPIRSYGWGSRSAIAELTGRPSPSAEPEAELWLGAHPSAPSRVINEGSQRSLLDVIAAAPARWLGARSLAEFGPRLPFMLKVLAVAAPLSLQAHPDRERAAAGFAAEQALGIAPDDPTRGYRDANHKPELVCALTPFTALCGLRPLDELDAVLGELGIPELRLPGPGGPAGLIGAVLRAEEPRGLVARTIDSCRSLLEQGGSFAPSYRCALRLAERYPADPAVVVALFLNLIHLEPGQAMFVPPGRLHSYLGGVGIEIMATSDNVVRGGFTDKRVDVPDLLSVLELQCGPPCLLDGQPDDSGWCGYPTPAADFDLSRAVLDNGRLTSDVAGPQILLCVDGALRVDREALARGQSAFLPASHRPVVTGSGTLFRATTGLLQ